MATAQHFARLSDCILSGHITEDGLYSGRIINVLVKGQFSGQIDNGGTGKYITRPCPSGLARGDVTMRISNGILTGQFAIGNVAKAVIVNGSLVHGQLQTCQFRGELRNGHSTCTIANGYCHGILNENFLLQEQINSIGPLLRDCDSQAIKKLIACYLRMPPAHNK